jgi:hypothetical protein
MSTIEKTYFASGQPGGLASETVVKKQHPKKDGEIRDFFSKNPAVVQTLNTKYRKKRFEQKMYSPTFGARLQGYYINKMITVLFGYICKIV